MLESRMPTGLTDLWQGLKRLPLAYWLASKDMKGRYARTVIGPFWSVLSNAIFVLVLGLTYGAIFGQRVSEFLPYLAVSMAFWQFINACLNEGPMLFQRSQGLIMTYSLPLSVYAHRLAMDKLNMLLHFLAVYLVLCIVYPPHFNTQMFLVLPAFLIYYVFGVGAGLLLGVLGVRWRDVGQAMSSLALLLFLITPIFWVKTPQLAAVADFNPFYHLLEVGRQPLRGMAPTNLNWIVAVCVSVGTLISGATAFVMGRRQVFYWL